MRGEIFASDLGMTLADVTLGADPAVQKRIAALGQEIPPAEQRTPAALAAFQRAEAEKWWPIIKAATIYNTGAQ